MNLRKLLSILLALTMLLTFVGCDSGNTDDTEDEVVGGGLIQARDDEVTDDVEVEDETEASSYIVLSDITEYAPEEGVSFYAIVISVNSNSLAVCGLNTVDSNNEGLFTVGLSDDAEITGNATNIDDITAGDIVVITFDGEVMETYPAQISGATRVCVVTHIDRLSEIEPYLPDGYENFGEYFPAWNDFEY